MEKLERLSRKLVYKGHVLELYNDEVRDCEGNVQIYDSIIHKGAAAVLPVLDNGHILMVKQYRNILDRFTIEIPAGGRNSLDEPMIDCAMRELEEETGYKTNDMELLLSINTTVAICNEQIDIFVARNLKKSVQNLDEGEHIDVYEYTIEELVDMVYECRIKDSKTVSAILSYFNKYCKK